MNQYEAMFLFDPTFGSSFEDCEAEVRRLAERAQAELVFCRKWDERRLAYRIKGRKRGVYVLVYFKGEPHAIAGLERDAQLSENILRLLVLRADDITPEMMERAVASPGAETIVIHAAEETSQEAPEAVGDTEQPEDVEVAAKVEAEPVAAEAVSVDGPLDGPLDGPVDDGSALDNEQAQSVD